jgi:hypothetical protein
MQIYLNILNLEVYASNITAHQFQIIIKIFYLCTVKIQNLQFITKYKNE